MMLLGQNMTSRNHVPRALNATTNDTMLAVNNDIASTQGLGAVTEMTSFGVSGATAPGDVDLTTMNTSVDSEYDYDDEMLAAHDRRVYTKFYMLAVILPFGLFFNTFAFIVFLRSPNINKTTTGRFLIALAIADNMFLIGEFLRWLNTADTEGQMLGLDFAEEYLGWCGTIYFVRYYGQLASGWLTVAITIERFIGIGFPLKASRISTKTSTHVTIALIYVISAAVTCFPYWTLHINYWQETTWCEYKNHDVFDAWTWVIIRVFSLLLPSTLIFVFTGLIAYKLHQVTHSRQEISRLAGKTKKHNLERQLTFMLVAVAVTFLILRLPYTLTYYLFDFKEEIWGQDMDFWKKQRLWLARDICDVIATTNHTVNFFLYCLTGSQFRSTVLSCIKCESAQKVRMRKYHGTCKSNTAMTAINSHSSSSLSLNSHPNLKLHIRPAETNGISKV